MRVLPFFKPKKGWHIAGTNLETDSGGGSYVLPTASADTLGGVKVGDNLSIDVNGVLSATCAGVDPSMIAGTESTTTSTHAYEIGEYFISSTGLLCKATSAIEINDTISIGTSAGDNAVSVTVGGELSELNSKIIYREFVINSGAFDSNGTYTVTFTDNVPPASYFRIASAALVYVQWGQVKTLGRTALSSKEGLIIQLFGEPSSNFGIITIDMLFRRIG